MIKLRLQLLFLFCVAFQFGAQAQIPDGTPAPDWTAVDLNGVEHDMSDILDLNKHVVLEFSATWCGPCWNFHNTGTLETLHDLYGPDGTDEIRVFYIEADLSTNEACMYGSAGCNSSTYGDWVSDHGLSFINLTGSNSPGLASSYDIIGYPTIFAVSGNGQHGVYNMYQQTNISVWDSWFFESFNMAATGSVVNAWCPGEGSVQVDVTDGYGNVSYEWSNGAGDVSTIDGLEAGTYTVTISDSHGYTLEQTYEVDGPTDGPLAVESTDLTDVGCNGDATGSVSVVGSGGNGGYSYAWDNGATGDYIDNLVQGAYTVMITDAQGCTTEETYFVGEPQDLSLTSVTEDADCGQGEGSVIAFATGGVGPWFYDYGVSANTNGTFLDVTPGTYVMTVTDFNGCQEFSGFIVGETEAPAAAAAVDGSIDCNITQADLSGVGSAEGTDITYAWSTTDGMIQEGADQMNAVASAAGTYVLVVTDSNTGCSSEISVVVEADVAAPTAEIAAPGTLTCNVTTMTIDASASSSGADFAYSWSTADGSIAEGSDMPMVDVDAPGIYTLVVTNTANGCTMQESVEVMLDDVAPAIDVTDAELDCSVTEAELCADVAMGTSVVWTTPAGEVAGTCISVSMAGTYMARATGSNGCETSAMATVTLSADLPQVAVATPETLTCTVTSVMIDASVEGDTDQFSVEWVDAAGVVLSTSDLSIAVTEPGVYTVNVVNNNNGCATEMAVQVDQVIINPVSEFSTALDDGVLSLESNSEGDPSAYSWSVGGEDASTTATFDETGTYEICLTVTNDCGSDTKCQDVYYVSELLFATEKTDAPCNGIAGGMIDVIPSGGEPGYTIEWTGPAGFTSTSLSISDLMVGEYTMTLNDNYGYLKSDVYTIAEPTAIAQSAVEIADETNADANGSIALTIEGGTGDLTYLWSNGETTAMIDGLSAGEYTVEVMDENGCIMDFGPFNVESTTVSVADLEFVAELSVYPIPANNYLNVEVSLHNAQTTQMRVLDAYGKVISTQTFTGKEISTSVDVTTMPSGMYYLEFGNKTGRSLEKFVVVK